MHHEHGYRAHQHTVARHGDYGSRGCRNRVDLHRDFALVVTEHGVNLGGGEDVPARTVDPDRQVALLSFQFFPECAGRDLIPPEGLLVDRAFQTEDTLTSVIPDEVPEFLHWRLPP